MNCTVCGGAIRADNQSGLCSRTKECRAARESARYAINSVDILRRQKRYRQDNPERMLATTAAYREANRELIRQRKRDTTYRLAPDGYALMLEAQAGACRGCGATDKPLRVDHDHACCPKIPTCGKCNRGLLCDTCNRALGFVVDSPETLDALANYLREYSKRSSNE